MVVSFHHAPITVTVTAAAGTGMGTGMGNRPRVPGWPIGRRNIDHVSRLAD